MKQFISTKFFLALQEASEKGTDICTQLLKNEYDKFAILVFSESRTPADKKAHHNALAYTCVELAFLIMESKKKM